MDGRTIQRTAVHDRIRGAGHVDRVHGRGVAASPGARADLTSAHAQLPNRDEPRVTVAEEEVHHDDDRPHP